MRSYTDYPTYRKSLLNQEFTCTEIVESFLQRIEEHKNLNAFIKVYREDALEKAKALDKKIVQGETLGKLAGMVIGVKDLICQKDKQVSASSKILQGFHSVYTATALDRLMREDVIVIGSLNCDEFGMGSTNENSFYGPVKNAKDENKVSGGSSGGSAVVVQANLCHVALGTDTGGSVRQPASFCGVVGFKPTYGKVSRYGLVAYASSFDQIGLLANNTNDLSLLTSIMSGPDGFDATISEQTIAKQQSSKRLAYCAEALSLPGLDSEIRTAFESRIEQLRSDGWVVDEVSFPLMEFLVPTYYVLTCAEASTNLSRYDGVHFGFRSEDYSNIEELMLNTRSEGFGKEVKKRIMLGTFVLSSGYYDAYAGKAQKARRKIKEATEKILSDYDAIISPTTPSTAYGLGEVNKGDPMQMYLGDVFTVQANLCGLPAISIPLFEHPNGMPFGLHLLGQAFQEDLLIDTAAAIQN